jgi:flagellar biosynthesis/type III secretory pathway M-ring protein FliF/YscJ
LLLEPPPAPQPAPQPGAGPVRFGLPALKFERRTMLIAGGAALGLVALALVGFRLLRRRKKGKKVEAAAPAELPAPAGASATSTAIEPSGSLEEQFESQLAERAALEKKLEAQALHSLKLSPVITKTAEVLARHLREKITKDPEVSAQVLRTWIREEEV